MISSRRRVSNPTMCSNLTDSEILHPYRVRGRLAQSGAMSEVETQGAERANRIGVHGAMIESEVAAPEWIALLPAGEFSGRDGRGPFRLSDAAAVIAATRALEMDAGIPIDYDHATDFAAPEGRPAPAAGWIKELEERAGGLWGRVEWTEHGAAAVATREYRYVSPVFEYAAGGEVERLLRAALTNNPNLYLTAISARAVAQAAEDSMRDAAGARAGSDDDEDNLMETGLEQIRVILGLEDGATADQIVEAVRGMVQRAHERGGEAEGVDERGAEASTEVNSGGADPARYVPMGHFQRTVGELNTLRAAHARERAERAVGDAIRAGKLVPAQREWAISYCQADFNGFQKFAARQPAVALGEIGFEGEPRGAMGRGGRGGQSEGRASAGRGLSATEMAVCSHLGIGAEDFVRRKAARAEASILNP